MDRIHRPATPALLDVLEPATGLSFDVVELEELLLAVDDRIEYGAGGESRVVLAGVRRDLMLELGRLVAS